MSIKALDRIHTISSLLFIPLFILLFYLNDSINIPMPVVLFILIIYTLIVEIVGTYTLAITQGKKNTIVLLNILWVIACISFYGLNYFLRWTDLLATQVYITFIDVWVVMSGVVGLQTNTVVISRGKPYVYEDGAIHGRVFNWLIIAMGVILLVFLYKDDLGFLWNVG